MYHSIDFFYIDPLTNPSGSKVNTWDDWGLVGSSRPVIAPAKPITNLIKITGASGFFNASEILTGYPTYESRVGSLEFIVLNSFNKEGCKRWIEVYNEVTEYLHGQELCCVLEDEPDFFYKGVFSVNEFASGEFNSTITIDYELEPYKYKRQMSSDDWLWDPFNFVTGVVPTNDFSEWNITTGNPMRKDFSGKVGVMPVCPEINIINWTTDNAGVSAIKFTSTMVNHRSKKEVTREQILYRRDMYINPLDPTEGFNNKTKLPLIVMYNDCVNFKAEVISEDTADITFDIQFREGRL